MVSTTKKKRSNAAALSSQQDVISSPIVYHYDALVLGAGPAGESAAINLAKHGQKVLVVDERAVVGGNCTHLGTIPSKALRQTVYNMMRFQRDPVFKSMANIKNIPLNEVLNSAKRVIDQQVTTHQRFYEKNDIERVHGCGAFIGENQFLFKPLEQSQLEQGVVHFKQCLIATGSRPYRPTALNFNHHRVFDSDTILGLNFPISKIVIYGAGVIGCEYASIFIGLGYRVELINTQEQLLSYLDAEITDALSYYLRELGVVIRHQEEIESLDAQDDAVVLSLKSGKKIKGDVILWCNGRSANTEALHLDLVGVQTNSRGQIPVNNQYQSVNATIYAAGDVIGWPSLASAAIDQGRIAAGHMLQLSDLPTLSSVPTGIYTIPEISSIGKTEKELTLDKVPYEMGHAFFKHIARAQITGDTVGMLKILFHRETLEILGIHCFGNNAAEIVHIGQAVMMGGKNNLRYFAETTFNYPTMAEAYRIAALNGLNRLF